MRSQSMVSKANELYGPPHKPPQDWFMRKQKEQKPRDKDCREANNGQRLLGRDDWRSTTSTNALHPYWPLLLRTSSDTCQTAQGIAHTDRAARLFRSMPLSDLQANLIRPVGRPIFSARNYPFDTQIFVQLFPMNANARTDEFVVLSLFFRRILEAVGKRLTASTLAVRLQGRANIVGIKPNSDRGELLIPKCSFHFFVLLSFFL
jgi:hypothetical protein